MCVKLMVKVFYSLLAVQCCFCKHYKTLELLKQVLGHLISFLIRPFLNVYEGLSAKNVKSQKVICNFTRLIKTDVV